MEEGLFAQPRLSLRAMKTDVPCLRSKWVVIGVNQCLKDVDHINRNVQALHNLVSHLDKDPDHPESNELDDKKLQEGIAATTAAIVATRTAIGRISAELDNIAALLDFES